jgi:hypothetical protein
MDPRRTPTIGPVVAYHVGQHRRVYDDHYRTRCRRTRSGLPLPGQHRRPCRQGPCRKDGIKYSVAQIFLVSVRSGIQKCVVTLPA